VDHRLLHYFIVYGLWWS